MGRSFDGTPMSFWLLPHVMMYTVNTAFCFFLSLFNTRNLMDQIIKNGIAYKSHYIALKSHNMSFESHVIAQPKIVNDIPVHEITVSSSIHFI